MPPFAGQFVWHELMTTDAAAARLFYCKVIGWEAQDSDLPGIEYTRLMLGTMPAAGLMTMPPDARAAGARTGWTGYIGVDDADAMAARVQQAGGKLLHPVMGIPGIGRFAGVTDPQGAPFALFQPASPMEGEPPPPGMPGTAGWHELRAAEWPPAFAFYADLFGWEKGEAIDMGPMGTYQIVTAGGGMVGGMMTRMDTQARPSWLIYFNVSDIEAAAARVTAEGGQVTNGPHPVPGGSVIIQCTDPQGGLFALVAPPA